MPKPQLAWITVVMPCQDDGVKSGSQNTWASKWVWVSTNPGARTNPSRSTSSAPSPRGMVPMRSIKPSLTPTSARYPSRPDPSTTSPPLRTRSMSVLPACLQELLDVVLHHRAFEEVGVHAGVQLHRVHEHELLEVVLGDEPVLDQLMGLDHHVADVGDIPVADVGTEHGADL